MLRSRPDDRLCESSRIVQLLQFRLPRVGLLSGAQMCDAAECKSVILCWLVRLIPDMVLVEIEEKHEHTGFLSRMQKPGFSVYFVVVNTCHRLYYGFLFKP